MKDGDESLGVILIAEARLDVDSDNASLVHEVAVLRHQVSEAVSDPPSRLSRRPYDLPSATCHH